MATMTSSGLSSLIDELKDLGELDNGDLTDKMLNAGGEVIVDAWKKGIKANIKHPNKSTGDLINSVSATHIKKIKDVKSKNIMPDGYGSNGTPNMLKVYNMHYGNSKQTGKRFVDDIEKYAEGEAIDAMEKVFDEFKTGGK